MNRKIHVLLSALLLTLSLITGCGAPASQPPAATSAPPALTLAEAPASPEETQSEKATEATEAETTEAAPLTTAAAEESSEASLPESGSYNSKEDVALYLHLYGHLPDNYITKKDAQALGWSGGSLEPFAPGKSIGGSRFGNYEGLLPDKKGRQYYECDIDTAGKNKRGAKRIVWSNDGLIYYTGDHYEHFELLYGEE